MKAIDTNAAGYGGAVFARGAVYFVPSQGATTANSLVMRYDTSGSFTNASSWAKLDTTTLMAGAKGYFGGVFDGQYLTLVPSYDGTSVHGLVVRYDTTRIFTQTSSWAVFDFKVSNPSAVGFSGGLWDGSLVYFSPTASSNTAIRFKPNAPNPALVMSAIDLTTIDMRARAFIGVGLQQGRVYYAPATESVIVRNDIAAPFDMASSWQTFNFASVTTARGYAGIAIDGRYVYFAPYRRPTGGLRHGVALRYDGNGDFTQATAWQSFDATTLSPPASGCEGAVFDGKYVYFVPHLDGVVARFDAKEFRGPLPAGYSGSFL
jgi:hypothetical protein